MSDAVQLPARPSLEQYKKLSKDLYRAWESSDGAPILKWAEDWVARGAVIAPFGNRRGREADVIARWFSGFRKKYPDAECSLTSAQYFLARAHGFESWPKFAEHVRAMENASSPAAQFEAAADAIVSGDVAALRELLRENPELIGARSTRDHHSTLLHYVAANGIEDFRQKSPPNIVEIAKVLLDAGADVNAESDAYGGQSTALNLTATSVHPQEAGVMIPLLAFLIDHGAIIEKPGSRSVVDACLMNGRPEAAAYLVTRGARLEFPYTVWLRSLEDVKREIESGANPENTGAALRTASEFGRVDVVAYLLDLGTDANGLSRQGVSALHSAGYRGRAEIVKLLLERNAHVDFVDQHHGGTALSWTMWGWATQSPHSDSYDRFSQAAVCPVDFYATVAMLVKAGAEVNPEWFEVAENREVVGRRLQSDARMQAALREART